MQSLGHSIRCDILLMSLFIHVDGLILLDWITQIEITRPSNHATFPLVFDTFWSTVLSAAEDFCKYRAFDFNYSSVDDIIFKCIPSVRDQIIEHSRKSSLKFKHGEISSTVREWITTIKPTVEVSYISLVYQKKVLYFVGIPIHL